MFCTFIGDEASPLSKNLMIVYMGQHPEIKLCFWKHKKLIHCNDCCLLTQFLKKKPWFIRNLYSIRYIQLWRKWSSDRRQLERHE